MNSTLFFLLTISLFPLCLSGNMKSGTQFSVEKIAELPPTKSHTRNPGVAGAFSGITGDKLIIAGGEIRPGIRTPGIIKISPVQPSFNFGWLNSAVLFLYFIVLVIIGYFVLKNQKNTNYDKVKQEN